MILKEEGIGIEIRPETTGKPTQFGTLEEILNLSSEIEGVYPCLDFAHIYARSLGKINRREDFLLILEKCEEILGSEILKNLHIHVSGISYGPKGEKAHLRFEESEFNYKEFLMALIEKDVDAIVICESPTLEEDALLLQKEFANMVKGN